MQTNNVGISALTITLVVSILVSPGKSSSLFSFPQITIPTSLTPEIDFTITDPDIPDPLPSVPSSDPQPAQSMISHPDPSTDSPPPPILPSQLHPVIKTPASPLQNNQNVNRVLSAMVTETKPSTYTQVISSPQWCVAMGSEFDALMVNGTWSLCPRPPDEEVFMEQPQGFVDENYPDYYGFIESTVDYSFFIYATDFIKLYVLVYVDDILVTGVQASRDSHGLHLRQTRFITDLLHNINMVGVKPLNCPTVFGPKLSSIVGKLLAGPTEYRRVVGVLQYCTISQPDTAYAVNQLCQFMHSPREPHWVAVKRVLRYLKGSIDYGLYFSPGDITLQAYYDSDWAGNPDDRRSTTGYGLFLGQNLITNTEAEYRSLKLYWIRMLMKELGVLLSSTPTIWCDNIGAIALASNLVFHARTKHIEVDYHFIREKVLNKDIQVKYISTQDQIDQSLMEIIPQLQHIPNLQQLVNSLEIQRDQQGREGKSASRFSTIINGFVEILHFQLPGREEKWDPWRLHITYRLAVHHLVKNNCLSNIAYFAKSTIAGESLDALTYNAINH
uniref:Reverse transcriptase Ty1/copia-type domain-containing protein n=1 Tax=Salix viminalis TaxID=40686 RepID=A0A6N2K4J6_SALVM